jgi:hypothetical protein
MTRIVALAALTLALIAWAQTRPDSSSIVKLTNCLADGGTASATLASGKYLMTVHDSRTTVCFGSPCDAGFGGSDFPAGAVLTLKLASSTRVLCYSSADTGDVHFLRDALP